MKKNLFIELIIVLLFLTSCSIEDTIPTPVLDSSGIVLNIGNLEVLMEKTISITFGDGITIDSVLVSVDLELKKSIYLPPYEYKLNGTAYSDGEHQLKIEAFQKKKIPVSRTVRFRADNTGPFISDIRVEPNQVICDKLLFNPIIEDAVSKVKNVQFLINDSIVTDIQESTNYSFEIDPSLYQEGPLKLKFIMEDTVGNVSADSIMVLIRKPILKIHVPNEFTRASVEKLIIVLSDNEGNFIDSKEYSNQSETLKFCQGDLSPDEEYMLTFFEIFDNSIYNVFCYSNLSKNKIGNEITLKARPLTNTHASINLNTEGLNLAGIISASGQGYSMVNIDNVLDGTLTTSYANDLGSSNTLITAYSTQTEDYKWAFIDHLENLSSLNPSDFTNDQVISNTIDFNTSVANPFLRIYGFENSELMNVFSGHNLFKSQMSKVSSQEYKYHFPDIFSNYLYSVSAGNYYKEGLGLPAQSIAIPQQSVDFSMTGSLLNFQGISNYEVGKIRLKNQTQSDINISSDNPSVIVEFIFDGSRNSIIIPKLPDGLFEGNIDEIFNNAAFSPVQAIAENYESYDTYADYLQNVLISSNPYYLTSNSRERVFKSMVSSHILPVWEYPYNTRF
ncbi:MAG: hypothetical protein COB81_10425 [Flavobacteriaceae bacterium]|nr:MAG: hypothetical protein COB81_10425 [Flavobacteriaceae bacterium]